MEIIYRKGNLLNSDCELFAHGCNAQGVMGSGVARAIRSKYPITYTKYNEIYRTRGLALGEIIPVVVDPNSNITVINCITQQFYGRDPNKIYVSYDAIRKSMMSINNRYGGDYYDCIALPKIGAGLGGGDWNIISKIIEEELTDLQAIVYAL